LVRILGREVLVEGTRKAEWVAERVAGKDVLDLGIVEVGPESVHSEHWLHRHVVAASKSCLGVDIDAESVRAMQDMGLNVIVGDVCALELPDTYDVVVAGDIIEHVHDLKGLLEGVVRHLRVDGEVLILTPNPWFWVRFVQGLRNNIREHPQHTAWYSPGTMAELLSRFDLEVVHWEWGSSQTGYYRLPVPKPFRHSSFWVVARRAR
jgi:SAM-dependent methyltransferase